MLRTPSRRHPRAAIAAAALLLLPASAAQAAPGVRLIARDGARVEAALPPHLHGAALHVEVDGRRKSIVDRPATFSVRGLHSTARAGWHRLQLRGRRVRATTRFALGRRTGRRPPTVVLTHAPARTATGPAAVFRYSASGGAISCAVDGRAAPCSRRSLRTTVSPGRHTFRLRARARRGTTTLSWTWTVAPGVTPPASAPPAPPTGTEPVPVAPSAAPPSAGGQVTGGDGGFGAVLMADSFDRETSQWDAYGPRWPGNGGNGVRDQSALSVAGGVLNITARMVNGTLVSGAVATKLNITYGRVEFRVRTDPDPSGATSGVVLMWPQSNRWPIDGETDIYETGTDVDRSPFSSFVHFGADNQQVWVGQDADGTQWHAMAMEWTPTAIRFYRDGALVGTVTDPRAIPHVPQHLCIQLDAFSPSMSGTVRMQVDDVRILAYNG